MLLSRPDDRTKAALARLRGDSDFHEILAWLQGALFNLDQQKRVTSDGVLLRQQQGAAQAIAELVDHANGNKERAIAIAERTSSAQ
jgi:hypothetical protein